MDTAVPKARDTEKREKRVAQRLGSRYSSTVAEGKDHEASVSLLGGCKPPPDPQARVLVDTILRELDELLASGYADGDRISIPPERLMRASLLQVILQHAQRTAVDGTVDLPPAVPLVRGSEH